MRQVLTISLTAFCLLMVVITTGPSKSYTQGDEEIVTRYNAWAKWMKQNPKVMETSCDEFEELCELGPESVPGMIRIMRSDVTAHRLGYAVTEITKKRFVESEWLGSDFPPDSRASVKLFVKWWAEDRRNTRQEFEKRYLQFKEEKKNAERVFNYPILWKAQTVYNEKSMAIYTLDRFDHQATKFGKAYLDLEAMGIDIIPLIIEQVKGGNTDLIPLLSYLTDGEAVLGKEKDEYGDIVYPAREKQIGYVTKWWETNNARWILPARW